MLSRELTGSHWGTNANGRTTTEMWGISPYQIAHGRQNVRSEATRVVWALCTLKSSTNL